LSEPIVKHVALSALVLALFAMIGTGLVAYTEKATRGKIREAERQAMLDNLHAVLNPSRYNNVLYTDLIMVTSKQFLGSAKPVPVFRARMDGTPVALILSPVAPDGYGGAIRMLVGVDIEGKVTGVRILAHHETPGLGDGIEERRSNWVHEFDGKSLENPSESKWRVKRDSGFFDQFTGATITPRAVVKAVKNTLLYVQQNQPQLFAQASPAQEAQAQQQKSPAQPQPESRDTK